MLYLEKIDYKNMGEISEKYDKVYLIVRSIQEKSRNVLLGYDNVFQRQELSPSWDLFRHYIGLSKSNQWNKEAFMNEYVPVFLREMINQRESLVNLYNEAREKNIAIACFCQNEDMCHRSIVMGLIQGAAKAKHDMSVADMTTDYSEYFLKYWNIKRTLI